MALSASTLTNLRTKKHTGTWYLSINQPETLWSAVVNEDTAIGDDEILYDGGSGSGFSRLKPGMRVNVTQANDEVRIARFKEILSGDATSGEIALADNGITWINDDTFEVIDDFPLLPYVPRFTIGGSFFKDFDITYTDENLNVLPVCIAGPHRAGFVSGGSFAFTVDLTNSYAMAEDATISSYACELEPSTGGTVTDNLDGTFDVSITTEGQYWLKCTVTDSNSKEQTTRRRVFAHSTDKADSNYPFVDVQIATLNGDFNRGGYSLDITLRSDADIVDDALVVLWYVPTVDGVEGDPTQLFAGYVLRDTISRDWDVGEVRFQAGTIDKLLANQFCYSITLEAVRSPSDWYEYAIWLTSGRIIHHYWRWHSTLFEIADVFGLADDDTTYRKFGDTSQGDLLSMANRIAKSAQSVICTNKQGQIYYVADANLLNAADRAAIDTTFTVLENDIQGDLTITGQNERVAQVKVSGIVFDFGTPGSRCANAPAEIVYEQGKSIVNHGRQTLRSADHATELAGQVYARENNPYPRVAWQSHGGYFDYLDVVPQAWLQLSISAGDNPRGFAWTNKKMLPRTLRLQIEPDTDDYSLNVTCETEVVGGIGVLISCVSGKIVDYQDRGPPVSTPDIFGEGEGAVGIGAFSDNGFYLRGDDTETWDNRGPAFDNTALGGCQDPFWRTVDKANDSNYEFAILLLSGVANLRVGILGGKTWGTLTPLNDPPNSWSDGTAPTRLDMTYRSIVGDRFTNGIFYMLAEYDNASNWRGWLLKSLDNCNTWTYYPMFTGTAPTGLRPLYMSPDGGTGTIVWVTIWKAGTLYLQKWNVSAMTFTETSLGSATEAQMEDRTYTAAPFAPLGDADQVYVYGRMDAPAGLTGDQHVIKSANSGSSFSSIENGWSDDRCAAFWADDSDNLYAVREP